MQATQGNTGERVEKAEEAVRCVRYLEDNLCWLSRLLIMVSLQELGDAP